MGFSAQGKCLLSVTLMRTSCHFRGNDCHTGSLTPIFQRGWESVRATFQLSLQGVRDQGQLSLSSLMSDILLKHRHLLGGVILPCTVAWIKISFISVSHSLSLTLSLSTSFLKFLSNPPSPILTLVILVEISQPGEQSKCFFQHFPSFSYPLSNIQGVFQKVLLSTLRYTNTVITLTESTQ